MSKNNNISTVWHTASVAAVACCLLSLCLQQPTEVLADHDMLSIVGAANCTSGQTVTPCQVNNVCAGKPHANCTGQTCTWCSGGAVSTTCNSGPCKTLLNCTEQTDSDGCGLFMLGNCEWDAKNGCGCASSEVADCSQQELIAPTTSACINNSCGE